MPTNIDFNNEDFLGLPLRAVVAFAARCARRVQPLYDDNFPDASERSIRLAVSFAGGSKIENTDTIIGLANLASQCAPGAISDHGIHILTAAARAGHAAKLAEEDKVHEVTYVTLEAANEAAKAAEAVGDEGDTNIAMKVDLKDIKAATGRTISDHSLIQSGFFGPLWPNDQPKWFSDYLAR